MAGAARPVCLGAKLVLEEPGYPANRSWRGHLVLRALSIGADRCVAVSPAIEDYFVRLGIPQRKTRLVMNGAPEPELPPKSERDARRAALGIAPSDFVVGSVGRMLDSHKRFSDLIRAVQQLRADDPTIRLLLVGDGPDRHALESLAGALGVSGGVTFVGYRSDVGPMYALMDAFALVSEAESFGLVLVEAMYCGLAVVGTKTSGIENVVADGVTGILVPVGSVPGIAQALQELRHDRVRRAELGAAGRERAVERFSTARYVADVERLYEDLLGGGTPVPVPAQGVRP
jgi:glycosyltransferase involved in cell wall biosynthesis